MSDESEHETSTKTACELLNDEPGLSDETIATRTSVSLSTINDIRDEMDYIEEGITALKFDPESFYISARANIIESAKELFDYSDAEIANRLDVSKETVGIWKEPNRWPNGSDEYIDEVGISTALRLRRKLNNSSTETLEDDGVRALLLVAENDISRETIMSIDGPVISSLDVGREVDDND